MSTMIVNRHLSSQSESSIHPGHGIGPGIEYSPGPDVLNSLIPVDHLFIYTSEITFNVWKSTLNQKSYVLIAIKV